MFISLFSYQWLISLKSTIKCNCISLLSRTLQKQSSRVSSVKNAFLEFSQNSQENNCVRVSFLKKRLWHRCFLVNFAKFLRTFFLTEHLRWLLLAFQSESTLYSFRTSCLKQAQYLKFK